MSLFLKTFLVTSVAIGLLAYYLWPSFPPGFEEPNELAVPGVVFSALNLAVRLLYFTGAREPYMAHRALSSIEMRLKSDDKNLGISRDDVTVDTSHTMANVPVIIFTPKNRPKNSAALLFFHGGGYVVGSAPMYAEFTAELAAQLGCLVVSVDYRLAPQHVLPAAREDSVAVTKYFLREGYKKLDVDPKRISLAGDSAGAHLVASLFFSLVKEGTANSTTFKSLTLMMPLLQFLTLNTPSYLQHQSDTFLPRDVIIYSLLLARNFSDPRDYSALASNNHTNMAIREKFAKKFNLPKLAHRGPLTLDGGGMETAIAKFRHFYEDPMHSPLFGDVKQFPATVVVTSEWDILRDDGLMLLERLKASQRKVSHVHVKHFHSGLLFFKRHAPARRALKQVVTSMATVM